MRSGWGPLGRLQILLQVEWQTAEAPTPPKKKKSPRSNVTKEGVQQDCLWLSGSQPNLERASVIMGRTAWTAGLLFTQECRGHRAGRRHLSFGGTFEQQR